MNLNQIMTQIRGLSYSKKDSNNNSFKGAIPVLRAGNIQDSKIIEEDYVYVSNDLVKNKQYLKHGDVLIAASSGSISIVGKAAMIEYDMNATFGAFCKVLRPNSEKINIRYFKHFFETDYYKRTIKSLAEGANINNLKTEHFDDLEIPLPPLDQQKKIAAILDAADACRQKTKALIEKYDELTQSLFLDTFGDTKLNPKGWPTMSLVDACEEVIDCPHSTPKYVVKETEYPCIRTTELNGGSINWSKMKYLDYEGYIERTKRLVPKSGDIIYGREGTFGEAAIVPAGCQMSLGQRVMLFRPKNSIMNSTFFHAVIRSKGLYHQALRVTCGSTVGHINVKDIKKFKLIITPIKLQNQFAERVQAIEEQKTQAEASLAQAEDLFNSLLQRAFKGELTSINRRYE